MDKKSFLFNSILTINILFLLLQLIAMDIFNLAFNFPILSLGTPILCCINIILAFYWFLSFKWPFFIFFIVFSKFLRKKIEKFLYNLFVCSFARSFKFFWKNRSRRCDDFGPKIIKFRAILAIFRPFEDFRNVFRFIFDLAYVRKCLPNLLGILNKL